MPDRPRILVVGAGYAGMRTALRLERALRPGDAAVTLVNPENFMTWKPLLPEVASGMLEPRHAVVPLRHVLRRTEVVVGTATAVDQEGRRLRVCAADGNEYDFDYDHLVVAIGSVSRVPPIPGLAEHAIGFQNVAEALYLHNEVLAQLEVASATQDRELRARALTFVFVGGGYSGVEALGELRDMAAEASAFYPDLRADELRWVLIEATDRILPTVDRTLMETACRELESRGVEIRLRTQVEAVDDGRVTCSDGTTIDTDLLVWTAGAAPDPALAELGLPTDERGYVPVDPTLAVVGMPAVWAAGDCAAVPDPATGGVHPATAQHAEHQADLLAANLVASLRGRPLAEYRYRSRGEFVTLGRHAAVGQVGDRHLVGFVPWSLRRLYHVARMPGADRKLRVWVDWTTSLAFRRDVVSLGSIRHPMREFRRAARQP